MARTGYFGSYARGDWGVGSDLDIVVVVDRSDEPFERRSVQWDATELPVPAEILVFTEEEIKNHPSRKFRRMISEETVWVWERGKDAAII